jgi:membrane protease YdiL (CAAX protease family)
LRPHSDAAPPAVPLAASGVFAAGCLLLLVRPQLLQASANPTLTLVLVFVVLLVTGLAWPLPTTRPASANATLVAIAIGVGAFALGRVVGGGTPPATLGVQIVALNTLAAVSEEAFFRRFVYGVLAPLGAVVAVAGSALLFALVHVTVYGAWVLPIDLLAGLLFGWQRWATGSWRAPALTHALANVLVVL